MIVSVELVATGWCGLDSFVSDRCCLNDNNKNIKRKRIVRRPNESWSPAQIRHRRTQIPGIIQVQIGNAYYIPIEQYPTKSHPRSGTFGLVTWLDSWDNSHSSKLQCTLLCVLTDVPGTLVDWLRSLIRYSLDLFRHVTFLPTNKHAVAMPRSAYNQSARVETCRDDIYMACVNLAISAKGYGSNDTL